MKWTVLSDNRSDDGCLSTEHGLAILLETTNEREQCDAVCFAEREEVRRGLTEWHKVLLDTGASDAFVRNADSLGVNLSDVEYVFISHGHGDHAGGLRYFLERNQYAKVFVSPDAIGGKFFSKRGNMHGISTDWSEIDDKRLIKISQTCEIAKGMYVIAHIPQIHSMPKGNRHLFVKDANGEYVFDDFRHELALYADGLLFTGCAHSGLENILAACPWPVRMVVGGFHLLDGCETEEELTALAQRLKEKYPLTQFHTSHCTGDGVVKVMKSVMGEQLLSFHCGTVSCINIGCYDESK